MLSPDVYRKELIGIHRTPENYGVEALAVTAVEEMLLNVGADYEHPQGFALVPELLMDGYTPDKPRYLFFKNLKHSEGWDSLQSLLLKGSMDQAARLEVSYQLASTLDLIAMNTGWPVHSTADYLPPLYHLDLKPANLMVQLEPNTDKLMRSCLMDFQGTSWQMYFLNLSMAYSDNHYNPYRIRKFNRRYPEYDPEIHQKLAFVGLVCTCISGDVFLKLDTLLNRTLAGSGFTSDYVNFINYIEQYTHSRDKADEFADRVIDLVFNNHARLKSLEHVELVDELLDYIA